MSAPTRRSRLATPVLPAAAASLGSQPPQAQQIARRHSIVRTLPTPDFFEGMLLGNGDIGVCLVVRPDAIGLHLGKLDVWDIRVSEDHIRHVLPFDKVLELWRQASERAKRAGKPDAIFLENHDPELVEYVKKVRSSYAKPWPRPWPCGTLWLHWDSRQVEVRRQELDISSGVYSLLVDWNDLRGRRSLRSLECFVSWSEGHILLAGDLPVVSAAYYPHTDPATGMPLAELETGAQEFLCHQRLPATAPTDENPKPGPSPQDRSFCLSGRLAGGWHRPPAPPEEIKLKKSEWLQAGDLVSGDVAPDRLRAFFRRAPLGAWRIDLALVSSLDHANPREHAPGLARRRAAQPAAVLREEGARGWAEYWSRSSVELEDRELERIWYHNQYFLACCLKEGKVAPGLFGNWSMGNIGTAWHGDYHMNYNTQQVFWGVLSSNHVDQHLPYVKLVENLMPMAEWNARVQFGLPGAYFPHSAYPVPSNVNPYPVPPWGYEICETPWTVQSLWWHYQYTLDEDYLRRVYPLMRAATDFLVAYVKKGEDGKYHIIPSVSPENWGLTVDFRLNRDCIIDLALTEFLLDAMLEASKILGRDEALRPRWEEIRRNLAPYPEGEGPYGPVWLDVVDAPQEWVYNVPVTSSPVFPAEQVGLDRRPELLDIARRTVATMRLEGGNDLVWQPLVRARLGMLDLEWFKREVRYCLIPNGAANDRVRQIGGRYRDWTNFDFMMRMGIWTENLALPAVINECLLQSTHGVIRLFPNTTNLGPARFRHLRAKGAFLVSAAWDGYQVTEAEILSEKGAPLRLVSPWPEPLVLTGNREIPIRLANGILEFATEPGRTYRILPRR
jgi:hypothetical protein